MTSDLLLRRLRWVMVGVIAFDVASTLYGQPPFYWHFPDVAQEGNKLVRIFLKHGMATFLISAVLYTTAAFIVVSTIPRRLALVVLFAIVMGHYFGASTWWVFRWGFGVQAAVIYGILLAVAFVLCGVGEGQVRNCPLS